MLRMNRHFNSAASSFLVSGYAPLQNSLRVWGQNTRRLNGFGKLAALPAGYSKPGSGLATAEVAGEISSFTQTAGVGSLTISMAAGRGINGTSDGIGTSLGQLLGLAWGYGEANGANTITSSIYGIASSPAQSDSYSEVTGSIFAAINIAGQADGVCLAVASGNMVFSIIGTATGASLISGAMGGLLDMSAQADGASESYGAIVGQYSCNGSTSGYGSATAGDMFADGWLYGISNGSTTCTTVPYAYGFMSGSTALAGGGELTADKVANAVWSYSR